jgi:hypothetical protein
MATVVEFHHVLPEGVYDQFADFINEITDGEFQLDAVYNPVPLANSADSAKISGSAMHEGSHPWLDTAWVNLLAAL